MAFEYTRKVFYYETDKMGIAHHSNYIRWFEEARLELLDEIGLHFSKLEQIGIASPVFSISCEFKKMISFGDTFTVVSRITSYDGIRLTVEYSVLDASTRELRAKGSSSHCFMGKSGVISLKRSFPEIYSVLEQFVEESI